MDALRSLELCAIALICAAACGGDEAGPELTGTWLYVHDGGYECATGLELEPGGDYTFSLFCALQGGGWGAQVGSGTYEVVGDEIVVNLQRSSCPGAVRQTSSLRYELDGDSLTLGTDSQVLIMERLADGDDGMTGGAAIVSGCWDEDGLFTPSPVRDL